MSGATGTTPRAEAPEPFDHVVEHRLPHALVEKMGYAAALAKVHDVRSASGGADAENGPDLH